MLTYKGWAVAVCIASNIALYDVNNTLFHHPSVLVIHEVVGIDPYKYMK